MYRKVASGAISDLAPSTGNNINAPTDQWTDLLAASIFTNALKLEFLGACVRALVMRWLALMCVRWRCSIG